MSTMTRVVVTLTLIASGRMMTLVYISRVGEGGPGDPPNAWLMPLVGDAAIGLAALAVAVLVWRRRTMVTWVVAISWSALGAFDALAALLVDLSAPWPEFFMLEVFGRSMFFVATAMHVAIIVLLFRLDVRADFGVSDSDGYPVAV